MAERTWRLPDGRAFLVRSGFYLASCDHCGWIGSSEECGEDRCADDSDVYCPKCGRPGCDMGKVAETATAGAES